VKKSKSLSISSFLDGSRNLTSEPTISNIVIHVARSAQASVLAPGPAVHMTHCIRKFLLFLGLAFFINWAQAKSPGADLSDLLFATVQGNPTLKAAWLEVVASGQDLEVSERGRWPVVSAIMESRTGTVSSTPTRAPRAQQPLWDGGRIESQISESESLKKVSTYKYYQQQQQVFLGVVNAWQSVMTAKERMLAADSALSRLKEFQSQMLRRVEAQASPRIDLELVDARVFQTEVEYSSAQALFASGVSRLEQITGLQGLKQPGRLAFDFYNAPLASLMLQNIQSQDFSFLVSKDNAVLRTQAEVELARARYNTKDTEKWPQLFVRVDQPVGKAVSYTDTRMSAFLGLQYTPNAGFSNLLQAQALLTRVESSQQAVETTQREVQEAFENDREGILSSKQKVASLERAVSGSNAVRESYERQFQGGKKSWLDLLNAVRELTQNEYALADAKTSLMGAVYKYQVRAGIPLTKGSTE
jgi:adhesin transport system outer membrane protein